MVGTRLAPQGLRELAQEVLPGYHLASLARLINDNDGEAAFPPRDAGPAPVPETWS